VDRGEGRASARQLASRPARAREIGRDDLGLETGNPACQAGCAVAKAVVRAGGIDDMAAQIWALELSPMDRLVCMAGRARAPRITRLWFAICLVGRGWRVSSLPDSVEPTDSPRRFGTGERKRAYIKAIPIRRDFEDA
jgi:hypothetical protein